MGFACTINFTIRNGLRGLENKEAAPKGTRRGLHCLPQETQQARMVIRVDWCNIPDTAKIARDNLTFDKLHNLCSETRIQI